MKAFLFFLFFFHLRFAGERAALVRSVPVHVCARALAFPEQLRSALFLCGDHGMAGEESRAEGGGGAVFDSIQGRTTAGRRSIL